MKKCLSFLIALTILVLPFTTGAAEPETGSTKTIVSVNGTFSIEAIPLSNTNAKTRSISADPVLAFVDDGYGLTYEYLIQSNEVNAIEFNLSLPSNSILEFYSDPAANDDTFKVENENRQLLAIISGLTLEDANGKDVETSVTLNGTTATFEINNSDTLQYPLNGNIVVARALGFSDYYNSGQWITRADGVSLELNAKSWRNQPNKFQYTRVAWATVVTEFSGTDNWYNENGLEDQHSCHVDFAALQTLWHLEPWRPDVGYVATVFAQCNPS